MRPKPQDKHTACAVAPSVPDMLTDCAPKRAGPHHRFSTVENRSHHLPAPTCVQASVRPDTQGKHAACLVAPSLFDTLADCAPPRAQSHHRFSTVENRSRRPTTPSCLQVSFDRIPEVSIQPAPSRRRAVSLRHARRLCAETGTVSSPFLDGRKSVPSPSRTNMRASLVMTGYPRR